MRAAWRLLHAVAHALAGWWTITFAFPRLDAAGREAEVQAWAVRMLEILGVSLDVRGEPVAQGPALLVANHISWLDILVLHAARFCRFVSKADVKHWPVIGTLATGAGTLYIERDRRRDAVRVVHHMAERLRAGDVVAIFPEGTTSDGTGMLPFHANLLQAPISAHAPVQPVALSFHDRASGAPSLAAAYLDDDTLVGSVWRLLSAPPMVAQLRFGALQPAAGRDRRAWAHDLREDIQALRAQDGTR
jgi:1-acyl-sn-glycerol-3-phosphate acyltransferase